jgi:protein gp37
MKNSAINWTDHTANFWWGCQKVSEGCKHCYAETLSKRFGKQIWGLPQTTDREHKSGIWKDIVKWDADAGAEGIRRRVFVSSMSDFLEDHPQVAEWRSKAKYIIRNLKNLDVLILTKRPQNAAQFLFDWWSDFPAHVWMGTTVENQKAVHTRLDYLAAIPSKVHFVSVEPQLEQITLHGEKNGIVYNWLSSHPRAIHWVICGGESGPSCRPFSWDWARSLRDQCKESNVAFWMKQGGGHPNKREKFSDIPEDLRIRELPE